MIKRTIFVTFQKEGIHCYPAAATDPRLEDVSFLANPHRHMFHYRVEVTVDHDDRDIEFIQLKRFCLGLYENGVMSCDYKSCEMLAGELIPALTTRFGSHRSYKIEVSEDGENGAIIETV